MREQNADEGEETGDVGREKVTDEQREQSAVSIRKSVDDLNPRYSAKRFLRGLLLQLRHLIG